MKELKITLDNGSVALINEVPPDRDGNRRFVVTSEDGSFDMFTYTPNGKGGDGATSLQKSVLLQIMSEIPR